MAAPKFQDCPERRELEAVLASKAFLRAPNISRILRYICEQTLAGEAVSIKEYTVAVEALGRPASFSPEKDSIVRVEFSRLRKNLARYYETEDADHDLRIVLPQSGYVPQFAPHTGTTKGAPHAHGQADTSNASQATLPEIPIPERMVDFRRGVAVLALCVALVLEQSSGTQTSGARAVSASPSISKLGAVNLMTATGIRIRMGLSGSEYRDNSGQSWLPDQFFTGGDAVARPDRIVRGTFDFDLYQSFREGDFSYDIPAKAGTYELHLHFVETAYGQEGPDSAGEGERIFNVTLNGKALLSRFDLVLDARGANIADERVFKDVSPAEDGFIHLRFSVVKGKPSVCAIELLPSAPGRMRPVRIVTGNRVYLDKDGQMWGPDRYFLGGRTRRYWSPVRGTEEGSLYASERFGAIRYAIPVPDGRYRLTLKFVEHWYGSANAGQIGGAGSRAFDVYFNGTTLLKGFDIAREAGGEASRWIGPSTA